MNKRPDFLTSPLTLHYSCLSLEGLSLPITYLSFKNQITHYVLSETMPIPQALMHVLPLCPDSMHSHNCPDPIAWNPRSNAANICWELTMYQALCMQKWNIIHIFKEFKVYQQTSRPTDTPGYRWYNVHRVNLLISSITWGFREGFPKEVSSNLGFESKTGIQQVLLRNTSNIEIICVLLCP